MAKRRGRKKKVFIFFFNWHPDSLSRVKPTEWMIFNTFFFFFWSLQSNGVALAATATANSCKHVCVFPFRNPAVASSCFTLASSASFSPSQQQVCASLRNTCARNLCKIQNDGIAAREDLQDANGRNTSATFTSAFRLRCSNPIQTHRSQCQH